MPVLVGQNFYRHGDRFREEGGEKVDKYVAGEFLVHTVYGCQVVVTNPTSSRQRLTVLTQLPVGAIPLAGGQYTKSVLLDLEPYRTQTVDYLFYFPRPGKFAHFPAHVGKNEKVVAAAKPATFDVVERLSKPDTSSWDYVSQNGTDDEVVAMLERENVAALNLDRIAFRMRDRALFERVDRAAEGPAPVQPDPVVLRPLPQRPGGGQGVPDPRRPAGGRGRRADRHPAVHARPGGPPPVRAPGVQAGGQRPHARAGRPPAGGQRRPARAVPPAPQAALLPRRN